MVMGIAPHTTSCAQHHALHVVAILIPLVLVGRACTGGKGVLYIPMVLYTLLYKDVGMDR